ncbi:MAG: Grass [Anaerosporomusa subterranea]|jgi:DNA-directed RNA polymerase specialized sigma subunit|nr:Grass [Anaerosporomusa subterranea]
MIAKLNNLIAVISNDGGVTVNNDITVEHLVNENIRLPAYIVEKYCYMHLSYCEFEELVSVGNIGLVKAAKHFDVSKGFKFSTYACSAIRGEIRRFLRDSTDSLTFSRPTKELYNVIQKNGIGNLDANEIAGKMKVPVEKVKKALEYAKYRYTSSLNEVVYSSGESMPLTLGDCIKSDEDFDSPLLHCDIMALLNELQRAVFVGLYEKQMKRQDLAKVLGLNWRVYEKIVQQVNDKLKDYFSQDRLIS